MPDSLNISTGNALYDGLPGVVTGFLHRDVSEIPFGGKVVRGYRSPDSVSVWLRDHTHQMKGFKYFEKDMVSAVDFFCASQQPNGEVFDYLAPSGVTSREPPESDVEYLLVEAVHGAWQATGDDDWMRDKIPALRRALYYSMSHPHRWSPAQQMVKRPFTIDTWDFIYNPDGIFGFTGYKNIDANTTFHIMHGDNTGMCQSCNLLAKMLARLGIDQEAEYWRDKAAHFRKKVAEICWNGRFLRHMVHLDPVTVQGVNEDDQLSLSNAYALNRGVLNHAQCVAIIEEYQRRRQALAGRYFAEWFSIHPPFPPHSFYSSKNPGTTWTKNPGEYVNGGILPLVGGELARGAFENGFEEYGWDILRRYATMVNDTGKGYLWYHPDGTPGISSKTTLATDGWGGAAMLSALIEGGAGIRDLDARFRRVRLAPRWAAAGIHRASVSVGYGASDAGFAYDYHAAAEDLTIAWRGAAESVEFHVLLPGDKNNLVVKLNQKTDVPFTSSIVRASRYLDFTADCPDGLIRIAWNG